MARDSLALGVDFGTSNSAAGYVGSQGATLVEMSQGEVSLPTTFFFEYDSRQTLIGTPANTALLQGADGRFMRALKRVLGTSLMHEPRQILNERVTFVEIIARFLGQIKARAEAQSGVRFERVLSGRPVVFHGAGDPREAQAEADLRTCYEAAGFSEVAFMDEPEAAAIASGVLEQGTEVGLVVDVGGGTSDFSLFRSTGEGVEILASHGVRIGGTDFDRSISIAHVMPFFGKGTMLRKEMGPGLTQTPNAIFNDLATWEKIPFLYTPQTRRFVEEMVRLAEDRPALTRLATVLTDELGHEVAFAVERAKIAANGGDHAARIDLDEVERGLSAALSPDAMACALAGHGDALRTGAHETLQRAGLTADAVDRVIFVGGSSLMTVVQDTMKATFPAAQTSETKVFSAVAEGLAIAAGRIDF